MKQKKMYLKAEHIYRYFKGDEEFETLEGKIFYHYSLAMAEKILGNVINMEFHLKKLTDLLTVEENISDESVLVEKIKQNLDPLLKNRDFTEIFWQRPMYLIIEDLEIAGIDTMHSTSKKFKTKDLDLYRSAIKILKQIEKTRKNNDTLIRRYFIILDNFLENERVDLSRELLKMLKQVIFKKSHLRTKLIYFINLFNISLRHELTINSKTIKKALNLIKTQDKDNTLYHVLLFKINEYLLTKNNDSMLEKIAQQFTYICEHVEITDEIFDLLLNMLDLYLRLKEFTYYFYLVDILEKTLTTKKISKNVTRKYKIFKKLQEEFF